MGTLKTHRVEALLNSADSHYRKIISGKDSVEWGIFERTDL
jgi:hypothetical protein